jgi:hypothetical protein
VTGHDDQHLMWGALILTLDSERLVRWGDRPVNRSCHGIWVDSHHDLYIVQPGGWGRARHVRQ